MELKITHHKSEPNALPRMMFCGNCVVRYEDATDQQMSDHLLHLSAGAPTDGLAAALAEAARRLGAR